MNTTVRQSASTYSASSALEQRIYALLAERERLQRELEEYLNNLNNLTFLKRKKAEELRVNITEIRGLSNLKAEVPQKISHIQKQIAELNEELSFLTDAHEQLQLLKHHQASHTTIQPPKLSRLPEPASVSAEQQQPISKPTPSWRDLINDHDSILSKSKAFLIFYVVAPLASLINRISTATSALCSIFIRKAQEGSNNIAASIYSPSSKELAEEEKLAHDRGGNLPVVSLVPTSGTEALAKLASQTNSNHKAASPKADPHSLDDIVVLNDDYDDANDRDEDETLSVTSEASNQVDTDNDEEDDDTLSQTSSVNSRRSSLSLSSR